MEEKAKEYTATAVPCAPMDSAVGDVDDTQTAELAPTGILFLSSSITICMIVLH